MLIDSISVALGTFISLLPIANPFSTAVVFVAMTARLSDAESRNKAWRACLYMTIILLVALFAGALIMRFFGISIPALRIAGGIIVAQIGLRMLQPEPDQPDISEDQQRALSINRADLAFVPLAMPMLSGPGSIAVTIGMAAGVTSLWEYGAIAVGIVLVAFVSWLVLRSAHRIVAMFGSTGMTALTRLMGFLLACVGVQFIATGMIDFLFKEETIVALIKAFETVNAQ